MVCRPAAPNVAARADVATTISVDPGAAPLGSAIELRVDVTNSGPEDAAPTQIVIIAGGTIVDVDTAAAASLPLECQITGTIATCVFERFPVGTSVTIVVTATADPVGPNKSASARASFPDWGRDLLPGDNFASTSYSVFDPNA